MVKISRRLYNGKISPELYDYLRSTKYQVSFTMFIKNFIDYKIEETSLHYYLVQVYDIPILEFIELLWLAQQDRDRVWYGKSHPKPKTYEQLAWEDSI